MAAFIGPLYRTCSSGEFRESTANFMNNPITKWNTFASVIHNTQEMATKVLDLESGSMKCRQNRKVSRNFMVLTLTFLVSSILKGGILVQSRIEL